MATTLTGSSVQGAGTSRSCALRAEGRITNKQSQRCSLLLLRVLHRTSLEIINSAFSFLLRVRRGFWSFLTTTYISALLTISPGIVGGFGHGG